jgi:flavin reductase (DIM6/NTAB) family NADH-FMN oxidoreductase RutF
MYMSEITDPRQTILVTSRYKGKDNIITLSWHSPVSFSPELYAIIIGHSRYSNEIIKKSKVFCVNFMDIKHKKAIDFVGSNSGEGIDKFSKAHLTKQECAKIKCPRLGEALAYLECKVVNEVEAGDHTIFIGEVIHSNINKEGKRILQYKEGFKAIK